MGGLGQRRCRSHQLAAQGSRAQRRRSSGGARRDAGVWRLWLFAFELGPGRSEQTLRETRPAINSSTTSNEVARPNPAVTDRWRCVAAQNAGSGKHRTPCAGRRRTDSPRRPNSRVPTAAEAATDAVLTETVHGQATCRQRAACYLEPATSPRRSGFQRHGPNV